MHLAVLDPCHERWDAMRGDARDRHCEVCDRRVHDLSRRSEAEALAMLALFGGEGLCVRFEADETGAIRHAPRAPNRGALAAGIVAAAMATGCEAPAPPVMAPVPVPVVAETPVRIEAPPTATTADTMACPPGESRSDAGACEAPPRLVRVTSQGEAVVIQAAHFAYGSSALPATSAALLDAVATVLHQHPEITRVAVVGHTSLDEKAGARLGEARANAMIAGLAARSVEKERLVAESHGLEQPIADNATKEGRERNRRVQFRVLEQSACPAP